MHCTVKNRKAEKKNVTTTMNIKTSQWRCQKAEITTVVVKKKKKKDLGRVAMRKLWIDIPLAYIHLSVSKNLTSYIFHCKSKRLETATFEARAFSSSVLQCLLPIYRFSPPIDRNRLSHMLVQRWMDPICTSLRWWWN